MAVVIGIRVALGADEANIVRMVLREALVLAFAGAAIGLVGALALARLLAVLLYGVSPTDPPSFAVAVGFLLLFSVVASYPPARRATLVDPMVALRAE
ncbi:MAG TPA: FtsX-like permease family protein [Vicinamibacterales bacterium]|nr:FtsX-like permease family protein [Vicinamibacterales bacterium]